jgi:hypothetical protein
MTVTPDAPPVVAGSQPTDVPLDLEAATSQALMALAGRSADSSVCPFLRAGADGDMPPESAAAGHRCVALAPAVAVSERQRQLVCQVAGHPACPRHVRGEAAVRSSLAPGLGRRSRAAPAAIGTAVVLLLVTAAVAATSGLATPGDDVVGGGGAEASDPAGASSARPTDGDGQAPSPSADAPGASGLPSATVAPLATVSPTLVATRDLPVAWRKLEPCPASDPCYLYVVKRGDTLRHRRPLRHHDQEISKLNLEAGRSEHDPRREHDPSRRHRPDGPPAAALGGRAPPPERMIAASVASRLAL